MTLLITIFNTILYRPLFNALIFLYEYLPGQDFGVAVIVLTVLIKILFYPLGMRAIRAQKSLQGLQSKIKEIQEKYKNDREKQTRSMLELYKKEKINPFSGFLPLLVQLPILIALYQVFWGGLQPEKMVNLYSFLPQPGSIDPTFFGILNLAQPSATLAIFAGISQFFQAKIISPEASKDTKKAGEASQFSKTMKAQMLYFFPVFTVIILLKLPAAIALYWLVTTLFSIGQQYLVFKKQTPAG